MRALQKFMSQDTLSARSFARSFNGCTQKASSLFTVSTGISRIAAVWPKRVLSEAQRCFALPDGDVVEVTSDALDVVDKCSAEYVYVAAGENKRHR